MTASIPHAFIDALRACREFAHHERTLSAEQLTRLGDYDITVIEPIVVSCNFYRDAQYKPFVNLSVQGQFQVRCQRCCELMPLEVKSDQTLVLLVSDTQDEQNFAPEYEPVWLIEGEYFPLHQVVEDEILLSLPTAPLHDPENCSVKFDEPENPEEIETNDQAGSDENSSWKSDRPNPFAALAALKSDGTQEDVEAQTDVGKTGEADPS